jgi:hypothetical protein
MPPVDQQSLDRRGIIRRYHRVSQRLKDELGRDAMLDELTLEMDLLAPIDRMAIGACLGRGERLPSDLDRQLNLHAAEVKRVVGEAQAMRFVDEPPNDGEDED